MPDLHLSSLIDGSTIDIWTFAVAVGVALAKCWRHGHKVISAETGFNIIHGTAIFPLMVLSMAALSKESISFLATSNRIILSGAGCVALFAILEKEFTKANPL